MIDEGHACHVSILCTENLGFGMCKLWISAINTTRAQTRDLGISRQVCQEFPFLHKTNCVHDKGKVHGAFSLTPSAYHCF